MIVVPLRQPGVFSVEPRFASRVEIAFFNDVAVAVKLSVDGSDRAVLLVEVCLHSDVISFVIALPDHGVATTFQLDRLSKLVQISPFGLSPATVEGGLPDCIALTVVANWLAGGIQVGPAVFVPMRVELPFDGSIPFCKHEWFAVGTEIFGADFVSVFERGGLFVKAGRAARWFSVHIKETVCNDVVGVVVGCSESI